MRFFWSLVFVITSLACAAQSLEGLVMDEQSGEPLPFVSVLYNKELGLGTTTDVNGHFIIEKKKEILELSVSYIGYDGVVIPKSEIPKNGFIEIRLRSEKTVLSEVEIIPGENPALRIIRNAIAAKNHHDPREFDSYQFKAYSKSILTEDKDSTLSAKKLMQLSQNSSDRLEKHLLMSETVSIRKYEKPDKITEDIIGARLSGFKNTIYAFATDDLQKLGLYDDIIKLLTEYYLTPLADGADGKYIYILRDSVVYDTAITYIMDYRPMFGVNYEGLKGELHINSHGWAIEYVTAEPFNKGKIDFVMEQHYTHIRDKHWFPDQLNMLMAVDDVPVFDRPGFMSVKLFIDSVQLNIPFEGEDFDHVEREITKGASYVDDTFWTKNRKEDLSKQEVRTYEYMDSIGERYKFDLIMHASRNLYKGYFTFGEFEFKAKELITYNFHEGLRLGTGVYTNDLFSEKFRFGGYYGYGFLDKEWKYGGLLEYYFDRKRDERITFKYSHDLVQPGRIKLKYYMSTNFWNDFFRRQMDFKDEYSLLYKTLISRDFTLQLGYRNFVISPNTDYNFVDPENPQNGTPPYRYQFSEFNMNFRWAYKEMISGNMGQQISIGSKWPIFNINYSRGIKDFLDGQYDYNKLEAGVLFQRYIPNWGRINVNLESGYLDVPVPITLLYSSRGSYSRTLAVIANNTFQTMRFNEFFSDRYVNFFFNHNFGALLLRYKNFAPEIKLYHAMGIGTVSDPEAHQSFEFKTLDDGYFESGLAFGNLLKINFYNIGYLGLGVGAFYRYGANQFQDPIDNWAFKFSAQFSVN